MKYLPPTPRTSVFSRATARNGIQADVELWPVHDGVPVGVARLEEALAAAEAVPFGTELLGVAALAVDLAVGAVVVEDRVQVPAALVAGKAFLEL